MTKTIPKEKTAKVSEKILFRLQDLKREIKAKNMDEVIKYLFYELEK